MQVVFIPFVADAPAYRFGASAAALLTYVGVLGAVSQGVLVGRLAGRFGSGRLAGATVLFVALTALPVAPVLGSGLPAPGGPTLTPELVALPGVLGLLSLGNGLLNPSLAALVSASTGHRSSPGPWWSCR